MPYIWTLIHDVIYTEPPGTMSFAADWEINSDYDEETNPDPIRSLEFITDITFTDRAANQSLRYDIPIYYDIGHLWLHRARRWMSGLSPLRLEHQVHFDAKLVRVGGIGDYKMSAPDIFTHLTLEFNTALVASVRLVAYPPPVWVDP